MNRKGFTLVEILIVVIILGILAAIVIPQFTEASNDARESALTSDLQTLRSQLELYRVQHLDAYPAAADVVAKLTSRTDADGTVNAAGAFGPYLQKFPTNPFVSGAAGSSVGVGTTPDAAAGTTGWEYNETTGQIWPGDAAHSNL
ncbi:MAG: Type II secretion system protein G precursor [Planctomycetes bacterium ADurb.Bin126]|nr:MAG: Type II secretion system protein G precursor [Planctomycetes bacterium ADurb.Bin126]HOD81704.1 prepilin-type N-terminal cleavage/methylation domain-containing protein [Phycisphaerae bacterium]HQL76114.1 prepilin-type N-terminal cleavage/methylation domain-containing protein [Phycisphaerae bacterium]